MNLPAYILFCRCCRCSCWLAVVGVYTALALWTGEFTARRLRLPIVLTMPIAWAGVELVRTYFPIGFPWNLLGETQYRNLELIQFAEFTGTYGISALIIFFNAWSSWCLLRRGSRRLQTVSLSRSDRRHDRCAHIWQLAHASS